MFTDQHPGLRREFWTPQPSIRAPGSDAPTQNFTFVGDTRVCDDKDYARETLFSAPEAGVDFIQLWVSTGILAQFVAKAFAANLAVSLLAFVDPLSMHGGKYEAPKIETEDDEGEPMLLPPDKQARVISLLQTAAFRASVVWSFLLCSSVANLLYATLATVQDGTYVPGQDLLWVVLFVLVTGLGVMVLLCKCVFHVGEKKSRKDLNKSLKEGLQLEDSAPP